MAVVVLYHIPLGGSVAADALHACLAGLAALACWRLWDGKTGCDTTGAHASSGESGGIGVHAEAVHASETRTGNTKRAVVPAGALVLLCLAASAASVAVPLVASGGVRHACFTGSVSGCAATLGIVALSCAGTAVWEEIAFRRLAMEAVAKALATPGRRRLQAALICSAAFALFHLGGTGDTAAAGLRAVQVTLFGLAMAGLVERTGKLAPVIATHGLYDMVCFAPAALGMAGSVWEMPAESLSILETSVAGIAASLVFLVPAAVLGILAFVGQARTP